MSDEEFTEKELDQTLADLELAGLIEMKTCINQKGEPDVFIRPTELSKRTPPWMVAQLITDAKLKKLKDEVDKSRD